MTSWRVRTSMRWLSRNSCGVADDQVVDVLDTAPPTRYGMPQAE